MSGDYKKELTWDLYWTMSVTINWVAWIWKIFVIKWILVKLFICFNSKIHLWHNCTTIDIFVGQLPWELSWIAVREENVISCVSLYVMLFRLRLSIKYLCHGVIHSRRWFSWPKSQSSFLREVSFANFVVGMDIDAIIHGKFFLILTNCRILDQI